MPTIPTGPTEVRIKSCVLKTEKDTFKIFTIILEGGEFDGRAVESFDEFKAGETAKVTFSENSYGIKIKRHKEQSGGRGGNYPPKDYTFEKRRVALEQANSTAGLNKDKPLGSKEVLAVADIYFNWLNQK